MGDEGQVTAIPSARRIRRIFARLDRDLRENERLAYNRLAARRGRFW